jgi:hypothetical protein
MWFRSFFSKDALWKFLQTCLNRFILTYRNDFVNIYNETSTIWRKRWWRKTILVYCWISISYSNYYFNYQYSSFYCSISCQYHFSFDDNNHEYTNKKEQIRQHGNLLIGPFVLIILAIPRLIISFASGCMKSTSDNKAQLIFMKTKLLSMSIYCNIFLLWTSNARLNDSLGPRLNLVSNNIYFFSLEFFHKDLLVNRHK